jgi:hypothetical protein
MDDEVISEAVPEVIAPEQAAWAAYVSTQYLTRYSVDAAHRAFLAGYRAGYDEATLTEHRARRT